MAPFPQRRTTLLSAGAAALVATGLWIVSGFVNQLRTLPVRLAP